MNFLKLKIILLLARHHKSLQKKINDFEENLQVLYIDYSYRICLLGVPGIRASTASCFRETSYPAPYSLLLRLLYGSGKNWFCPITRCISSVWIHICISNYHQLCFTCNCLWKEQKYCPTQVYLQSKHMNDESIYLQTKSPALGLQ